MVTNVPMGCLTEAFAAGRVKPLVRERAIQALQRPVKRDLRSQTGDLRLKHGGASVLVNGAVFKTVSETARAGSGRFDSYTPPPKDIRQ